MSWHVFTVGGTQKHGRIGSRHSIIHAEYRIRIGDYRLRYKIDDENQVVILGRCQHRKNVYD
ncbi:type II toxin-antitoxin system RelE family toxin [Leptolyngbya sp. BL0902]|uniref:type II toxin-antitoxin system RelE family toxin n=1 Tax=Leptolyngbya sp. BL0902 TaxID=1115757 RepID=UPI0018E7D9A1|nr:type II toxin-antitoxin system RelE/ParE family toxin [Leptolyngbya sp. BL0902]